MKIMLGLSFTSNYLFEASVLFTLFVFLRIVLSNTYLLCLYYVCLCTVSCVPSVASLSGLPNLDCPFGFSVTFIKITYFVSLIIILICINTVKKSLKIPKGGNQNPYIEQKQTKQWAKEKGQSDK